MGTPPVLATGKAQIMKLNPLEELTEEFADEYADLVFEMAEAIAPYRPWWHVELSPDAQVYRWMNMREPIVTFLADVSPFMGWVSLDDAFANLGDLLTGNLDHVPPELKTDERADGLRELAQAVGPRDAAKHLRHVETLLRRRQRASALLEPSEPIDVATLPPGIATQTETPAY